jgi:hypothetical protein
MGARITEIREDTVPKILSNASARSGDDLGATALIRANNLPQVLGVEPCCERCRADEIAEQHRELPTFGGGAGRLGLRRCCGRGTRNRKTL